MRVSSENSRCFPSGNREESKRTGTLNNNLMLVVHLAFYVRERSSLARIGNKTFKQEQAGRSSRSLPPIV